MNPGDLGARASLATLRALVGRIRRKLCRLCLMHLCREQLREHVQAQGTVVPVGFAGHHPQGGYVHGPADRFLLVPKNRYRLTLLPGQKTDGALGVGWLTEANDPEGYDRLWGDEQNLERFRQEAGGIREVLTREIVDHCQHLLAEEAAVVDIGCGVGDLLAEVAARRPGASLAGLDFSAKAVQAAGRRLPAADLMEYSIRKSLPYPDAGFDVVLCTDVLEHQEHPREVAAELVRICRPGGAVVVVVPDGDVDQFTGHLWFWNAQGLQNLLAPWAPKVFRLPQSREFMALVRK